MGGATASTRRRSSSTPSRCSSDASPARRPTPGSNRPADPCRRGQDQHVVDIDFPPRSSKNSNICSIIQRERRCRNRSTGTSCAGCRRWLWPWSEARLGLIGWMVLSGRLAQLTDDQHFWRPSGAALTVARRENHKMCDMRRGVATRSGVERLESLVLVVRADGPRQEGNPVRIRSCPATVSGQVFASPSTCHRHVHRRCTWSGTSRAGRRADGSNPGRYCRSRRALTPRSRPSVPAGREHL
jgi:hypothetical protein